MTDSISTLKSARAPALILVVALALSACSQAVPFAQSNSVSTDDIQWMEGSWGPVVPGL